MVPLCIQVLGARPVVWNKVLSPLEQGWMCFEFLPSFSAGIGSSKLSSRHHSARPLAGSSAAEALPKPEERSCEGSDSDVGVSGLNGLAAVEKTKKAGALG